MTLNDYIKNLTQWANEHPEEASSLHVAYTQSGYYAEGNFAELYDFPEVEEVSFTYEEKIPEEERDETKFWNTHRRVTVKKKIIELGHSRQSY